MIRDCKRCGHQWEPRSEFPVRCPECKSIRWDEPLDAKYVCPECKSVFDSKVACSTHIRRSGDELHGDTGVYKSQPEVHIPPNRDNP